MRGRSSEILSDSFKSKTGADNKETYQRSPTPHLPITNWGYNPPLSARFPLTASYGFFRGNLSPNRRDSNVGVKRLSRADGFAGFGSTRASNS